MKTNKFWSIMMMLVLVLGTAIAFSSCGKDDDDNTNPENTINNNGNSNSNSNVEGTETNSSATALSVVPINGKYLSSVSADYPGRTEEWEYTYSSNKLLSFVYYYYQHKNNLIYGEGGYKAGDNNTIKKIDTNQDGLITSLVYENIHNSSDYYKTLETYNFIYSGKKLVKATFSTQSGSGRTFTDEYNFKWENGNIVQVEVKIDNRMGDGIGIDIYDIAYDQRPNSSKQNTMLFAHVFDLSLAMIGLTGEATQNLPCSYKHSHVNENGTIRQDSRDFYLTYTINNDGTIASETETEVYSDGTSGTNYSVNYTYIEKK